MQDILSELISPQRLYSRKDVLLRPSPVPSAKGLYAWYFRKPPVNVPTTNCATHDGLTLLYVGISPSNPKSKSNLRKRIRQHFTADAYGSTLRQSLGVLLAEESGLPIRLVGNGKRKTLTYRGEQWLDRWMDRNALVTWVEHPAPWEVEEQLFKKISLPLNIQGNQHHPFSGELKRLRIEANNVARQMPIVNQLPQGRLE